MGNGNYPQAYACFVTAYIFLEFLCTQCCFYGQVQVLQYSTVIFIL